MKRESIWRRLRRGAFRFGPGIVGLIFGVALFVWMAAEGVPSTANLDVKVTTTTSRSTRSGGCAETCKQPQKEESQVKTATKSPSSAVEKALDNDAGVALIRLIAALLSSALTAAVLLLLRTTGARRGGEPTDGPGQSGREAKLPPQPQGSGP